MAQRGQNMAAESAAGAQAGAWQQNPVTRRRIIILNALPLNALPRHHIRLDVLPVSKLNELAAWVQRRVAEGYVVEHYIRHGATIQALRSLGIPLSETPNAGLYSYSLGDVIVVVTLRNPLRGQQVSQVSTQDLESWIVTVL